MNDPLIPPAEMTEKLRKGFQLPPQWDDVAGALRELEGAAPKGLKPLMIQAATEIEDWRNTAVDCVRMLEEASALRVGQMDSASRVDEIARQIKRAMADAAVRLRAKL